MKIFIRLLSLYIFLFTLIGCSPMSSANVSSPDIKVFVNDELMVFTQQQPYFDYQNNRSYVPLRTIAETLGAGISWDQKARLIKIQQAGKSIEISPDSSRVMINHKAQVADAQPIFMNGYTMVPLRFVSEALDARVEWDEKSRSISIYKSLPLKILSLRKPHGGFMPGDSVNIGLYLLNASNSASQFWLGYSLKNPAGTIYDIEPKTLALKAGEKQEINLSWEVPNNKDLISGSYDIYLVIWDKHPSDKTAQRLLSYEYPAQIRIFRYVDNFNSWNSSIWVKETGKLGLSQLDPDNIIVENGLLFLEMPANTTAGAEISSRTALRYGSYEVNMKLPDLPSAITGFFLYKAPDLYNEIDIELYNSHDGKIMFTLYSGGRKSRAIQQILPFDPTADFHSYRFDYLAEGVSFYVDDILLQEWTDGFSTRPMNLMLNSWFPDWLDGKHPSADQYVQVDWIRY